MDAQTVKFVNENLRPRAEELRALKARIDMDILKWAELSANVPNDTTVLNDGREAEGVSRLTGTDITNMMAILSGFKARFVITGVENTIIKHCVRSIEVR